MSSTLPPFSQEDAVFATLVASLPEEVSGAMKQHKLDRPGVLRSYERTHFLELGLATIVITTMYDCSDSSESLTDFRLISDLLSASLPSNARTPGMHTPVPRRTEQAGELSSVHAEGLSSSGRKKEMVRFRAS